MGQWFGADYYAHSLGDTEHGGSWLVWDKRRDEAQDKAIGSSFELIWSRKRHKRLMLRHQWFGFLSGPNNFITRITFRERQVGIDNMSLP